MAQIGDRVRYLNAVGGGVITKIEGKMAYVDEDGFESPVLLKDLVVVDSDRFYGSDKQPQTRRGGASPKESEPSPAATPKSAPQAASDEGATVRRDSIASSVEIEETPTGDTLNVVLGYEPAEIKHLNTTTFDAYLVNDSNYYLAFSYMTRQDGAPGWTTRYAGVVEPNIQVWLGEVRREDLVEMDRIALQYIAYKQGKEFALKSPVLIERPLDTTKFCKLHCFQQNPYFDTPVIAVDIVKNDVPQRLKVIDSAQLEDAMRSKKAVDRPAKKPVEKRPKRPGIIEVDLHINELLDNTSGLSNTDMLQVQMREFRSVMDANMGNKGQKIVFIHGKGEGVLRKALLDELSRRYKRCEVQDASFREYGFGATQVTIH
ncbi:MAG: DUF2027 domain-containing protein [Bacteroidales bacterium]|nr:DUF2027 domain-containing protein [Bacteroidales bacterium]MCD8394361.1 DUF2027 domain-containing protein [Bacteroidales bacterium]